MHRAGLPRRLGIVAIRPLAPVVLGPTAASFRATSRHDATAMPCHARLLALGAAALLAAALGLGPGCAAPTLPLPPPTALVSSPDPEGFVTVSGEARPDAIVMVYNESRMQGVIVMAGPSGAYAARLAAAVGEEIAVWQREGTNDSTPRYVVVR